MVDIETLGTGLDAYVMSIGAVHFDPEKGKVKKKFAVNIHPSFQEGRNIKFEDVYRWMNLDKKSREKAFKETQFAQHDPLFLFYCFCTDNKEVDIEDVYIWGNSNMFANNTLRDLYDTSGKPYPCSYKNDMDLASLKKSYELIAGKSEDSYRRRFKRSKHHDPLETAIYNAKIANFLIKELRNVNA
jgi:exodeoxyribonuclease VIII